MEDEMVTIREYSNPWETEWAQNVLASAGICCLIPDATLGYMYSCVGLLRVQVPSSLVQEAEKILAEQEFCRKLSLSGEDDVEEDTGDAPREPSAGSEDDSGPEEVCPACGGDAVASPPPPPPGGESLSERLVNALRGPVEMACQACGHRWDRREIEDQVDEEASGAIDAHDVCPLPRPRPCPSCGGFATRRATAPEYAGQSLLAESVKRFLGHGWLRCASCGHQWKE